MQYSRWQEWKRDKHRNWKSKQYVLTGSVSKIWGSRKIRQGTVLKPDSGCISPSLTHGADVPSGIAQTGGCDYIFLTVRREGLFKGYFSKIETYHLGDL